MILVTGGTGLVGSHLLVRLSQEEVKVRAIRRERSNLDEVRRVFSYYYDDIEPFFSKIEWVIADITDTTSLDLVFENIAHVYHSAAMISFQPKKYREMRRINIEGTANMINFSIERGVQKFCHVSSVAAVGRSINGQPIDESNEWSVEMSNYGYAITKHGAEMEVWRGTQEGLNVVIVNPGIILGEGYWNTGSGKMFSKVRNGMKFYTEGVTGYVDVKDVVISMISLMKSKLKNERYILISENKSFKSVFSEIAAAFGVKTPYVKVTTLMSEIGWRIAVVISVFTRTEPILTRHSAKSAHKKHQFSNAKIKKDIRVDFESVSNTIKRICAVY